MASKRSSTGSSKMSSSRAESPSSRRAKPPFAGRKVVSGRLELDFAADANGRTYLRRQYAGYPFHVCRTQFQDAALPGLATLYIQSSSGGVYEDDRLVLSISVGEGAQAHVTTQAATIVHGMPRGRAEQRVTLECQRASYVEYLPDPQILFPGSTFFSRLAVRIGGNATALVSDCFLQHDPEGKGGQFFDYLSEIVLEGPHGKPLAIDRLHVSGNLLEQQIPGVMGVFVGQGTVVVAGNSDSSDAMLEALCKIDFANREAVIGCTRLPNSAGILVRLLAADGAALRRAMHVVWCAIRVARGGDLPTERRK
jgi:urease accessory protein